ncbi:MAG: ABC transporter substrate-binding protein [Pelagimonas sp.]|jgi:NitT/TauT family transport system ATP-binding protein|nr:ABC transporter substrate-binding protein [Pelagimonas sp.]
MNITKLSIAYMPLVDAAPLIVAQEMGFARAEGFTLDLIPSPSWSSLRDMLSFGRVDAAQLLSPIPVAMALGLMAAPQVLMPVQVLSTNGNVIGVSRSLEAQLREAGHGFGFHDAAVAASDLARVANRPPVFGVPFPYSMHVELLKHWCETSDLARIGIETRTIPPQMMAQALAQGEVDAFCVGEPWGSIAVETGAGALLLPGCAIRAGAPEKVLAVRQDWARTEPHLLSRLLRATARASAWLSREDSRTAAAEILSRGGYLDMPSEVIDRALTGRFVISGQAEQRVQAGFVGFGDSVDLDGSAHLMWMAERMARRNGLAMETVHSRISSLLVRADAGSGTA